MDTKKTLTLKGLQQENAELQDQIEAARDLVEKALAWGRFHRAEAEWLRPDAERYRYIRDPRSMIAVEMGLLSEDALDEAVDRMIEQAERQEE